MRGFLPFLFGKHIRKSFLKSFWCAIRTMSVVLQKITGNGKKFHGQLEKKPWATGEKITGNVFQNYGQCFSKLRAMFFDAMSDTILAL